MYMLVYGLRTDGRVWVDQWNGWMGGFAKVDNVFWVDGWTSRFVGMGGMGTEMVKQYSNV